MAGGWDAPGRKKKYGSMNRYNSDRGNMPGETARRRSLRKGLKKNDPKSFSLFSRKMGREKVMKNFLIQSLW